MFVGGYATPELDRDSGEVIYVENEEQFKTADQTEDIKVLVEY